MSGDVTVLLMEQEIESSLTLSLRGDYRKSPSRLKAAQ